jgi:hypothetical protein
MVKIMRKRRRKNIGEFVITASSVGDIEAACKALDIPFESGEVDDGHEDCQDHDDCPCSVIFNSYWWIDIHSAAELETYHGYISSGISLPEHCKLSLIFPARDPDDFIVSQDEDGVVIYE